MATQRVCKLIGCGNTCRGSDLCGRQRRSIAGRQRTRKAQTSFREDLTGKKFNKLTVLGFVYTDNPKTTGWRCKCDCGNEKITHSAWLKTNHVKSCGCALRERNITHGLTGTLDYGRWQGMIARCYNENNPGYPHYGGRGIAVCDRWRYGDGARSGVECYVADVGPRPSALHSIDRIDNDGPYSPENTQWATPAMQLANRRATLSDDDWVQLKEMVIGQGMSMSDVARLLGVPKTTIENRWKKACHHFGILGHWECKSGPRRWVWVSDAKMRNAPAA